MTGIRGTRILPFVVLPLLLLFVACSSGNKKSAQSTSAGGGASAQRTSTPAAASGTAQTAEAGGEGKTVTLGSAKFNDHGTKDVSGQDEIDVEADDFYFEPTFLKGKPGQTIKLELENESSTLHNITVKGQQIDKDIPANGKTEVEVTFPQSGAVWFYCKYHQASGMNGELLSGNATPQPVSGSASSTGTSQSATSNSSNYYSYP